MCFLFPRRGGGVRRTDGDGLRMRDEATSGLSRVKGYFWELTHGQRGSRPTSVRSLQRECSEHLIDCVARATSGRSRGEERRQDGRDSGPQDVRWMLFSIFSGSFWIQFALIVYPSGAARPKIRVQIRPAHRVPSWRNRLVLVKGLGLTVLAFVFDGSRAIEFDASRKVSNAA